MTESFLLYIITDRTNENNQKNETTIRLRKVKRRMEKKIDGKCEAVSNQINTADDKSGE